MKNIVRIFALALVATGAVASYHTAQASASTKTTTAQVSLRSAVPLPACEPGSGSCGF